MKASLLALTLFSFSLGAFAQGPSFSEESFCSDRRDKNFVKDLTMDRSNLMNFRNHGGIANGGVCWWHSRFQRNALYLTVFKPELEKPTEDEARELVKQIRHAKNVVVIPGFNNFAQFSRRYEHLVQRELEKWQKGDGILRFAWVKGLSGEATVSPEKMRQLMDQLYEDVEIKNNISYNKLQIPGIDAHAWLVIHMEKVSGGYNLEILDSNFPLATEIYRYREGDVDFNYYNAFAFTPYLERTREMDKINKTIASFCK